MGLHDGSLLPELERGRKRREVKGGGKKHNGKETERWKGRNLQERNGKEFVGGKGGRKRNRKVWDDPHVKLYLNTHCQEVTCPSTITLQHPF